MKTIVASIVLSLVLAACLIAGYKHKSPAKPGSAGSPGAPAPGALRQITLEVLGMT